MDLQDVNPKIYPELVRISNSPAAEARLVDRCKIILSFLRGVGVSEIATTIQCGVSCITRFRSFF